MKYQRWYDQIIGRARDRKVGFYIERHHIVPRALGGSDDPINLVDLTYREHFLVHWLLTKIYTGRDKYVMVFALHCMSMTLGGRIVASWQFDVAKRVMKREYLIRAKARIEEKRAIRKATIRAELDAAKAVPEMVRSITLKRAVDRNRVTSLAADFLRGNPQAIRRRNRKADHSNIRAKMIVAEANKILGLPKIKNAEWHEDDLGGRKRLDKRQRDALKRERKRF